MKIARSSNARSKIRQWLKRERRDENVVTGRASFESELKRCGVSLKELTNDENLPGILKKLTYRSLDDLYAAIGYGGISSLKVIGRIREDIQRILHQHQVERQAEVPVEGHPEVTRPAVPKRTHSEKGIIVEGLSNCLVKFSKCCTPVPGETSWASSPRATACPSTGGTAPTPTRPAGVPMRRAAGSRCPGPTMWRHLPHHPAGGGQGPHQPDHGHLHGAVLHQDPCGSLNARSTPDASP